MSNHRAPRHESHDGAPTPQVTAGIPGRRRANVPASGGAPAAAAGPSPAPYAGRRIASATLDSTTSFDADRTVALPTSAAAVREPGRRKAARHTARGSLVKGLPSTPVLVGTAALAISLGGAVTAASQPTLAAAAPNSIHAVNSLSAGSSGISSFDAMSGRATSVSRSSSRQALADRAGVAPGSLQAAAESQVKERNVALEQLARKAEGQAKVIELNQWDLPIDAGVYHLTARFGDYGLWASFHTGLDFACPIGTPIHAIANGVITSAQFDGAYGNKTVETLEDGTELWYGHQTAFNVSPGDHVVAGQIIGFVGATGHVTGPHVHIEVRPGGGDPVDPYPAMVQHGLTP